MAEEEPQEPPPAEEPQEPPPTEPPPAEAPPAEETSAPILGEEPQPPEAAQETEAPVAAAMADLKAAEVAAAPSSPRPQSAPVRPEETAKQRLVSVTSDGPEFDLSGLMSFDPLQQLVGSLVKQQSAQLAMIQALEEKLAASNGANDALKTELQEALDGKADGASVEALAQEQAATAKQVVAVVSGEDPHQEQMSAKLAAAQASPSPNTNPNANPNPNPNANPNANPDPDPDPDPNPNPNPYPNHAANLNPGARARVTDRAQGAAPIARRQGRAARPEPEPEPEP